MLRQVDYLQDSISWVSHCHSITQKCMQAHTCTHILTHQKIAASNSPLASFLACFTVFLILISTLTKEATTVTAATKPTAVQAGMATSSAFRAARQCWQERVCCMYLFSTCTPAARLCLVRQCWQERVCCMYLFSTCTPAAPLCSFP